MCTISCLQGTAVKRPEHWTDTVSPPSPSGTNAAGSGLLLAPPPAHPAWPRARREELGVPAPVSQNTGLRSYVRAGPACALQTVRRPQQHVPVSSRCAELHVACSTLPVCHSVVCLCHEFAASPCRLAWLASSLVAQPCTCPLAVHTCKRFLRTAAHKLDAESSTGACLEADARIPDPGQQLRAEPGPLFPDTQVSRRHPSTHRVPTVRPWSPGQRPHTSRLTGRAFQFAVLLEPNRHHRYAFQQPVR